MDDFSEKIRSILSDEESVRQIRSLYETLSAGSEGKEEAPASENCLNDDGSESNDAQCEFDFSTVLKLQSLIGNAGKDDAGTALIAALRPHLSENRREKADKAIKILNIVNAISVLKESGLLGEII